MHNQICKPFAFVIIWQLWLAVTGVLVPTPFKSYIIVENI